MGKIIDKTKEFYSDLEGAEYKVYEGEDVPEGVEIIGSNVSMNTKGLTISRFGFLWGWSDNHGFMRNFHSPEEAINNYKKMKKEGFVKSALKKD